MPDTDNGNTLLDAKTGQPVPLAMQHLDISGKVTPAGAFIRATHRFKCASKSPLEAIYVFMMPRSGTLRRFIVKGEDFEVESKLNPREEARKQYEEGVEAGHLSVLAETSLDGMITLCVGQVRPDEEVSVILDMVVGVEVQDNKFRFRFPFTMSPNYHAKAVSSTTPDGGKIELPQDVFGDLILPEWKTKATGLHQVSFNLTVEAAGELNSVSSPSHNVSVVMDDKGTAEVSLALGADLPNRDLVIDVLPKDEIAVVLADDLIDTKGIPKGAPRWSIVVPSSMFPKATGGHRRICFLMDASGSMNGQRLNQAKLALASCLSALDTEDEFGLAAFGSTVEAFDPRMLQATDENRRKAAGWLKNIGTLGGTELETALDIAAKILGEAGSDIFVLTDGEVYQTASIIEKFAASGTRIHVLGIGMTAQDRFLSGLARRTGGVSEMVNTDEDVAAKTLTLLNAIRQPVATDVKAYVEVEGGKRQEHILGTVYQNRPVIITDSGKCGKAMPVKVKFSGDGATELEVALTSKKFIPDGLVALLWAGRQIEDLESKMDSLGADPKGETVKANLKTISTAYGLASRVMSLSAVVTRVGDVAGQELEQKVVPVGLPSDMVAGGIFDVYHKGNGPIALRSMSRGFMPQAACFTASAGFADHDSLIGCAASSMYSPELSANFLSLPENRSVIAASMTLPVRKRRDYKSVKGDENYAADGINIKRLCDDLMAEVARLESDGGASADDIQVRVLLTACLGLALLNDELDHSRTMYSMHLKKMAKFLDKNVWDDVREVLAEVSARLKAGAVKTEGDWLNQYTQLKVRPGYYTKEVLNALGTEFPEHQKSI